MHNIKKNIITEKSRCTGCFACKEICPISCIDIIKDELSACYPHIDSRVCINCGKCKQICNNRYYLRFQLPIKVYAAWSTDNVLRVNSASGGIASELYKIALKNNWIAYGVKYSPKKGVHFCEIKNEQDIKACQNSKYVYTEAYKIFPEIKKKLLLAKTVLFVGLPCQIAGLIAYLGGKNEHLITIDLICHGVPPADYLKKHINYIENICKAKTTDVTFRNPNYSTDNYIFSLFQNKDEIYSRNVNSDDTYQLGYHRALIYRENCYHCDYAKYERIGDITLGDYSGLKQVKDFTYDTHKVSCLLVNTLAGLELVNKLLKNNYCTLIERSIDEPPRYEKQLCAPSIKHKHRNKFEHIYANTQNYEKSVYKSLYWKILRNKLLEKIGIRKKQKNYVNL